MKILSYQPSKRVAILIHAVFSFIYFLLLVRAGVAYYESPFDLSNLRDDSALSRIIKRVCGEIYAPFWGVGFPIPFEGDYLLPNAIVMAILVFGLIHYGRFMKTDSEQSTSMASKILDLCRAFFFLAGALLVLLICIRMGVMLYQDIAYGRPTFGVGSPKK
jgi:hypothetical protein